MVLSNVNLSAVDLAAGTTLWSFAGDGQLDSAPIEAPDEQNAMLLTGLGAGNGYLVVPAGNVLNGWRVVP